MQVPGLPPRAILCVRSLRDPLPGVLALHRPTAATPAAWERALTGALDARFRAASRPAREPVPPSAEAVLFADQAELLACLAGDLCGGTARDAWWWRGLYPNRDLGRVLMDAWSDSPALVPAGVEHLARHGQAVRFARTLASDEVRRIVDGVVRAHGLVDLAQALAAVRAGKPWIDELALAAELQSSSGDRPAGGLARDASPPRSGHRDPRPDSPRWSPGGMARSPSAGRVASPWGAWAAEATTPGLTPERAALLGIALLVRRAPATARSAAFARAVGAWYTDALRSPDPDPTPAAPDPTLARLLETPAGHVPHAAPLDLQAVAARPAGPIAAAPPSAPVPAHAARSGRPESGTATGSQLAPARPTSNFAPPALAFEGTSIHTQLGGIFYLINLLLALELFGDFTQPEQPGLALPIWDALTLIARRLLTRRPRHDPVWPLLAALAGRTQRTPPGTRFRPPHAWRVPVPWLAPIPDARPWTWSVTPARPRTPAATSERLRVRHPAGFLVLDVARTSEPPEVQLAAELRMYPPVDVRPARRRYHSLPHQGASPVPSVRVDEAVRVWLGWLMPYVRARLRAMLGASRPVDLGALVCVHEARLELTPVHLDVYLALEALPIAIRLAGLDRDPGWVPAAGRRVAFHFD